MKKNGYYLSSIKNWGISGPSYASSSQGGQTTPSRTTGTVL
jgi:hypothetical protein